MRAVFVDELDLVSLGFEGAIPADTGRPAYHSAILLKIYIYGYLNGLLSIPSDAQTVDGFEALSDPKA